MNFMVYKQSTIFIPNYVHTHISENSSQSREKKVIGKITLVIFTVFYHILIITTHKLNFTIKWSLFYNFIKYISSVAYDFN